MFVAGHGDFPLIARGQRAERYIDLCWLAIDALASRSYAQFLHGMSDIQGVPKKTETA